MKQTREYNAASRPFLLLLPLLFLFLDSCRRPEEHPVVIVPDEFELELSMSAPSARSYATVPSEAGEARVNSLHLLFFEHSDDETGAFVAHHEIPPSRLVEDGEAIDLAQGKTLTVRFGNDSPLNKSTSYSILVIANALNPSDRTKTIWGTPVDDWLSSFDSFTEGDVTRDSRYSRASSSASPFARDNLLMSARIAREAGQPRTRAILSRVVARFDAELRADLPYKLRSLSIWNAYPETSIWERDDFEYAAMPLQRFYGIETGEKASRGGLYAFENYVNAPAVNDDRTTCLVIGLEDESDGHTYYYRQNICARDCPQQLKRNNVYRVSIQRVNARGAASELEAYRSEEVLLETIINAWNAGQGGEMFYNGESALILPASLVSFTSAAETREYRVYARGAGKLAITGNTLPDGLSATLDDDKLTLAAAAGEANPRGGYVELSFGSLRGIINVTQEAAVTRYLRLGATSVPVFAGNVAATSEEIRVNSSGDWTARIYNANYPYAGDRPAFAFGDATSVDLVKTGASGQGFTVSTTGPNGHIAGSPPVAAPVVSFLLVQLDDDPTVRKVLMLTQKPAGGFAMGSSQKQLLFDASGRPLPGASNKELFAVKTSDPDEAWNATLSGADAGAFQLLDPTGAAPLALPHVGDGGFVIKASDNALDKELSAAATVTLGAQSFVIKLSQARHVLSITPGTLSPLLAAGGTTPDVVVNSSAAGKKWRATLVNATPSQQASLSADAPGVLEIVGQPLGGSFNVTFPPLTQPFVAPRAAVTVQMEDYPWLVATLVVSQQSYKPRAIAVQTAHATYGRMDAPGNHYNYFSAASDALRARDNFGPNENAKVRIAAGSLASWPRNATVSNTSAVLFINNGLSSSQRSSAVAWRKEHPGNTIIFALDLGNSNNESLLRAIYNDATLRVSDPSLNDSDWNNRATLAARGGTEEGRARLWKYLVGGAGPFGEVNADNVDLHPRYDMVDGALSHAPPTLITLLTVRRENNAEYIQLAIDPVQNIVIIGNMDMFAGTNNRFPEGSDNWKFLHNFLAYVVNAAQYGDVFLSKFK